MPPRRAAIDDVRRNGVPGGELQSRHEDFSDLTHAALASKYDVAPRVEAACGSAAGREWAAADGTGAPLHELAQCAIDVPAPLSRQPGRSQLRGAAHDAPRDADLLGAAIMLDGWSFSKLPSSFGPASPPLGRCVLCTRLQRLLSRVVVLTATRGVAVGEPAGDDCGRLGCIHW